MNARQSSKGRRRGWVFSVRLTADERDELERLQKLYPGPAGLGPWLLWRALRHRAPRRERAGVVYGIGNRVVGYTNPDPTPIRNRLILDLCGGSGAWSVPYRKAGYPVEVVDWPHDVRTYAPPTKVWGVLAAPPCTEFSIATNGRVGRPRDFVEGMACVNACMRIVLQCRPVWWALENPKGHLSKFLGTPRDTWEPHDFGDKWTKRTSIWGDFEIPARGPFVRPTHSAMDRSYAHERATTPPGFARAFFQANP